ncbi:metalloreductase STEAP4 isoform X1 [Patella vulgata]|uniref:metalloreductase STEAP4 isoform X1 n=2 Tax=Patella vulgata TaxID=6465 RepID=UPI0024A9CD31|nr:metalloreductase STEAP4 isoform X1 [Patella vulgata]
MRQTSPFRKTMALVNEDGGISNRQLGIIGTGNFARALAKRCILSGYTVIIGSRRPSQRQLSAIDECLCDVELTTIADCIKKNDLIILAIHAESYKDTLTSLASMFSGKVVIDVSNREVPSRTQSNAEYLSTILPHAQIVKCFNVISAYVMDTEIAGGSRRVFVASDNLTAREQTSNLARDLGFVPVDLGVLTSSRKIENFVLNLFPGWKVPLFLTFGIFNLWCLYIVYIYFVVKTAFRWDQLFVKVLNKPLCMTAITILALTFLPGNIAGFIQLYNGTKHKRFPKWIDNWLKVRKQFGIISFVLVFSHVIFSVLLLSPTYYRSWFQPVTITIPANLSSDLKLPMVSWMMWKGEAACLVGFIAFLILCFLALTSLPSIGESLNWREWRFVQSKLGYTALILSVAHAMIMGIPGWIKAGPWKMFGSITFLSIQLPLLVLVLKLLLTLPCVSKRLRKIRRGWERNTTKTAPSSKDLSNEKYRALTSGCGCSNNSQVTNCCGAPNHSPDSKTLLPISNCDCSVV